MAKHTLVAVDLAKSRPVPPCSSVCRTAAFHEPPPGPDADEEKRRQNAERRHASDPRACDAEANTAEAERSLCVPDARQSAGPDQRPECGVQENEPRTQPTGPSDKPYSHQADHGGNESHPKASQTARPDQPEAQREVGLSQDANGDDQQECRTACGPEPCESCGHPMCVHLDHPATIQVRPTPGSFREPLL